MNTVEYEECKEKLRELLTNMESSSADEGVALLDSFVRGYEESLYNEIGRLTRQLHDSLTTFDAEERLLNLTEEDIPGAKERLKYVVSMTEQATQNVLGLVEKSIPVSQEINAKAVELQAACTKVGDAGDGEGDYSNLLAEVGRFLVKAKEGSGLLQGHLAEILMAQEYQDITGQIIRKVIDLVQEVEDSLVKLIKMTGMKSGDGNRPEAASKPGGPQVPAVDDREDRVSDQDDVDQLLASLGF